MQQRRAIQTVLAALSKVPFRRVDVAFDGSFMPKSAHNHVQVRFLFTCVFHFLLLYCYFA